MNYKSTGLNVSSIFEIQGRNLIGPSTQRTDKQHVVAGAKKHGLAGNRTPDHSQSGFLQALNELRDAKGVLYH